MPFFVRKYFLFLYGFLLFINNSFSQVIIGANTKWVSSSDTYVSLDNLGIHYNASPTLLNNAFQFTGTQTSIISGNSQPIFTTIILNKSGSGNLQLNRDIEVTNNVRFKSGLFNLNNNHVLLSANAFLQNESETSRFTDTANGTVSISINLLTPSAVNPGNLGASLSSPSYVGNIHVERSHRAQTINGTSPNSIARTYNIQLENEGGINAAMRLFYFDAENRNLDENKLDIWKKNEDNKWSNLGASARDATTNYVEQGGLNSFGFFTLSPSDILPVHSLQLSGIWKNNASLLTWTTLTETDNHHFEIERKYPEENSFTKIAAIASQHPDGNSSSSTLYQYNDATIKGGVASVFYRLKQIDKNGQSFYSNTIVVMPFADNEFIQKVYPTVVAGNTLFVQVGNMNLHSMQVQIFDVVGKRLFNQSLPYQSCLIRLPTLPAGSYRLLIQSGFYSYKVVFIK